MTDTMPDFDYDDKLATETKTFAPSYGSFKGTVKEVNIIKKDGEIMREAKNGAKWWMASVKFEYKNADGDIKSRTILIQPGLWFHDMTKRFITALGVTDAKGRAEFIKDPNFSIGATINISVGAARADEYFLSKGGESFRGYKINEWEGKRFVANDIVDISRSKALVIDMAAEENLRAEYKESKDDPQQEEEGYTDAAKPTKKVEDVEVKSGEDELTMF